MMPSGDGERRKNDSEEKKCPVRWQVQEMQWREALRGYGSRQAEPGKIRIGEKEMQVVLFMSILPVTYIKVVLIKWMGKSVKMVQMNL